MLKEIDNEINRLLSKYDGLEIEVTKLDDLMYQLHLHHVNVEKTVTKVLVKAEQRLIDITDTLEELREEKQRLLDITEDDEKREHYYQEWKNAR
jgi:hypothetical protein